MNLPKRRDNPYLPLLTWKSSLPTDFLPQPQPLVVSTFVHTSSFDESPTYQRSTPLAHLTSSWSCDLWLLREELELVTCHTLGYLRTSQPPFFGRCFPWSPAHLGLCCEPHQLQLSHPIASHKRCGAPQRVQRCRRVHSPTTFEGSDRWCSFTRFCFAVIGLWPRAVQLISFVIQSVATASTSIKLCYVRVSSLIRVQKVLICDCSFDVQEVVLLYKFLDFVWLANVTTYTNVQWEEY